MILIPILSLTAAAQENEPLADLEPPVGLTSPPPDLVIPNGMVFIPAGSFQMGADVEEDHQPVHEVKLDAFLMDTHEVTNAEYLRFCEESDHDLPEFWGMEEFHAGPDFPDHPVIGVTWVAAGAYAEWVGKRLPTEAEWEYAARGGLEGMKWPNGDEMDSTLAVYGHNDLTQPVGSFPLNGYGLYDMAGNVGEWTADWYAPEYYAESPWRNPPGPEKGKYQAVRGGGWRSGPYCNRVYRRVGLLRYWVDINVGFRCAKDLE